MRRLIAIILALAVLLALFGCKHPDSDLPGGLTRGRAGR